MKLKKDDIITFLLVVVMLTTLLFVLDAIALGIKRAIQQGIELPLIRWFM